MSLPDHISTVDHYNEIPIKCLGVNILDVGSSDGYGAVHSRHRDHFYSCEYLGVDIQRFESTYLPVTTSDIFQFETESRFDTILLLHVLEHFAIDRWHELLAMLNVLLVPGGWLVVNVPYRQREFAASCEFMKHKVLQIDEKVLLQHWEFQEFSKVGNWLKQPIIFRSKGENTLWATIRFVGRILTHHKYSALRRYMESRGPKRIVAIYCKEGTH